MTTGLIWGKFMPLHNGHIYLIDYARQRVDRVTILLCSIKSQPIPGVIRYQWLAQLYPDLNVQHCTDEIPQYPNESPNNYWDIWLPVIRRYQPTGPDFIFTSETYGDHLASLLGAQHICVDLPRQAVPISGIAIRNNPQAHLHFLPPVVQAYYAASGR
jgi:NadR type nicotinamide-nucleotide adenylyltransferase